MSITQEVDLTVPAQHRLPEHGVWNEFNPELWSLEEREFILAHLKESPAVALKGWDKSVPHNPAEDHHNYSVNEWWVEHPGVIPTGIDRLLSRIRDVREASPETFGYYKRSARMAPLIGEKLDEEFWGYDAIRQSILDSLEFGKRKEAVRERDPSAAIDPALYTRDARGSLHFQGVGSDRGMNRQFTCWISREEVGHVPPEWVAAAASDTIIDADAAEAEKVEGLGADYRLIEGPNFFECPVKGCNFRKVFKGDDEGDRKKARHSLQSHMIHTNTQADDHREAKLVIFG